MIERRRLADMAVGLMRWLRVSVYGDEPSPFHCGQKNNRQPETQNPFQAAFVYALR
ncbi:hypothetical protein [Kingella bonacorsii]|uniref:Uncharacterized protein n=1 Tax=Kingella bonacorsii TaxID=2796361 RepID=A0ABS1BQN7_9NEIS|nr:hypothetical protein [Kingella bonacorsii]MBK0395503.1 hypothetical protein [Kingella bonacorsii]